MNNRGIKSSKEMRVKLSLHHGKETMPHTQLWNLGNLKLFVLLNKCIPELYDQFIKEKKSLFFLGGEEVWETPSCALILFLALLAVLGRSHVMQGTESGQSHTRQAPNPCHIFFWPQNSLVYFGLLATAGGDQGLLPAPRSVIASQRLTRP